MTMIERVAKAIYERRGNYTDMAKAAIEAMREPTNKQIDAAILGDNYWSINSIPRVQRAYRAMIDAALDTTGEQQ